MSSLSSDAQSAATAAVEQAKRENARKLAQAEEDERQRKVQTSSDGNRDAPPSLNTAVVSEWTNVTDAPANPIRLAAPTAERHRASYFLPGAGHAKVVISVTKIREDSYHQLALIDLNTGTANAVFEPITTRRERTNNLYLSFHDGGHVLLDDQSRAPNHLFQAISAKTGKIVAETSPKIGVSNDFYANPSAGGDFVVANTTGQLWIWNIRANRVQPVDYPKLMAKFGSVRVVFSPNGRFGAFAVVMDEFNPTTGSHGYAARLYTLDLASAQFVGHVAYTWNNREAQITGCQFSPQGNRIAVLIGPYGPNDPQSLVVFDAATGKPVTAIDPVPPPSRCYSNIPQMIAWGPDEQSLLVGMSHLTDLKSKTIRPLALPVKKPTSVVTRNIPIMLDIVPTDRPESWIGYVRETVPDTEHREELRAEVIAIAEQN